MSEYIYWDSNEFSTLALQKTDKGYWLHEEEYMGGEVSCENDWFFPNESLPDELVILLCEADFSQVPLPYQHCTIFWSLTNLDEYSA